jgi:hypothetical protein
MTSDIYAQLKSAFSAKWANRMKSMKTIVAAFGMTMLTLASWAWAADLADIALPPPHMEGGMPLMEALKARQTSRAFSTKPLSNQVVSDLLWAAFGINRPESGKRTAPSARNWQEVEVYAVMEQGCFLYDAKANTLRVVAGGDLRKLTGGQEFVGTAPLNLVYVADTTRMKGSSPEDQALVFSSGAGRAARRLWRFRVTRH